MQAGGGSGNGAGSFGKYRLISLAVEVFIGAMDVGRQGNVTEAFEMFRDAACVT